jgi:UPF0755 protein
MDPLPDRRGSLSHPIRWAAWGIAFFLVLALGYVLIWPGHAEPKRFEVAKGAPVRAIARDLKTEGLTGSTVFFRFWVKLMGSHDALRPGVYTLKPSWSGFRIYRQLKKGPPLMKVTFPEGWTSRQMADLLVAKGIIASTTDFMTIVVRDKREGFLFPDTYAFNQGLEPSIVIDRLVRRFHEAEPKDLLAQAKKLGLSYRQIVTLASLVEGEARIAEERPIIAGVFYNRLKKRMHLESCATVEYALGKRKPQLTYKDLAINSPYNTYKHSGLPPGPICNPGRLALEAAAHPARTDLLFFFAEGNGSHHFSKTYAEHLAAQKHSHK